jgi:hypothetical protein
MIYTTPSRVVAQNLELEQLHGGARILERAVARNVCTLLDKVA